jgi:hypothetical protein
MPLWGACGLARWVACYAELPRLTILGRTVHRGAKRGQSRRAPSSCVPLPRRLRLRGRRWHLRRAVGAPPRLLGDVAQALGAPPRGLGGGSEDFNRAMAHFIGTTTTK